MINHKVGLRYTRDEDAFWCGENQQSGRSTRSTPVCAVAQHAGGTSSINTERLQAESAGSFIGMAEECRSRKVRWFRQQCPTRIAHGMVQQERDEIITAPRTSQGAKQDWTEKEISRLNQHHNNTPDEYFSYKCT